MHTYEFKLLHSTRSNDILAALNEAGKQGWDVVAPMDVGRDYSFLMRRALGPEAEWVRTELKPSTVSEHYRVADQVSPHRLVPRIPPDPNIPWAGPGAGPQSGLLTGDGDV